jgi:PilZ domain
MTVAMQHREPAAAASEERRYVQRRRVLKGATLSFNRGYSAFECVVRNQSDGGARLSLAETFALPTSFRLAIAGETQIRSAQIIWRKPDEMGVTFVG